MNHANQIRRFGFSTSEDALTWSVFKFLHDSRQLTQSLRLSGLPLPAPSDPHPTMLLWGAPVPLDRENNPRGWELRERLISISDWLCENAQGRTEPDVLLDLGQSGLFMIEVKHGSHTIAKGPDYEGWSNYYHRGHPIRDTGCYQLARNWCFGIELALSLRRPFTLIYLGPHQLFQRDAEMLQGFEASLMGLEMANFRTLAWDSFLGAIPVRPDWFLEYIRSRGYLAGQ